MPSTALGVTVALCPTCGAPTPAKISADADGCVGWETVCPVHGGFRADLRRDVADYLKTLRHVKPASLPRSHAGDAARSCPDGCGFCARHEQHLCMPIFEITSRCDLDCPVCLNDSARRGVPGAEPHDWTPATFARVLDRLLEAETRIDLLNLSGGEPLLHPRLLDIVDMALARPGVVRVSVSTNGLAFLERPELAAELQRRDVVVSLQFDGLDDEVYRRLRGRPLAREKREILALLARLDVATSLTFTLAGGVNDHALSDTAGLFFRTPNIVSLMVQPLAFTGRARAFADAWPRRGVADAIRLLADAGLPWVAADDFSPLPCSHPLCYSLAFYLRTGDRFISLAQAVDADTRMDLLANRVLFGLDDEDNERLRSVVYDLWSGPVGAAPEGRSVLDAARALLRKRGGGCGCCDPRAAFKDGERAIKSIFIHAFQDASAFDLSRARRCCQAYPQPDGRLLPACRANVAGDFR